MTDSDQPAKYDPFEWYFNKDKPTFNKRTNRNERYVSKYQSNQDFPSPVVSKPSTTPGTVDDILFTLKLVKSSNHVTFDQGLEIAKAQKAAGKAVSKSSSEYVPKALTRKSNDSVSYPKSGPIIDEYEDADFGDTYDDYKPAKLDIGVKHPDSVVETSSLSVVIPPDITYKLKMPKEVIDEGRLSSLQLETVIYACQKHSDFLSDRYRAGYLIGDGPGVGKGRIISGIIFENICAGRMKALWLSVSSDLKFDALNDLQDVGCDVHVASLHKVSYNERIEDLFTEFGDLGVLFTTYSSLIGESHTPDTLYRSRYEQLMDWLTPKYDGVIVFDECHKAKNLMPSGATKPTKTALFVLKLQNDLPQARIVYCSATGASEPRNMAYMTRLGLWGVGTPFINFESFLTAVEKRGVGAMELIAIDMKQRGVYLARQLSFAGVTFKVQEITLSPKFKEIYNYCVQFWDKALSYFKEAADELGYSSRDRTFMMAHFYAAHQRFFKGLCIASKVPQVVEIVKNALDNNKSVVIGLQSTGEAVSNQLIKQRRFPKIISTLYGILTNLINKQFPTYDRRSSVASKRKVEIDSSPPSDIEESTPHVSAKKRKYDDEEMDEFAALLNAGVQVNRYDWKSYNSKNPISIDKRSMNSGPKQACQEMIDELLDDIENLHPLLPPNTLDELIDQLGGPACVAEMTGRKGRIVRSGNGDYIYQSRGAEEVNLEYINVVERDIFMDGEKLVAIISEAASAGISLQSDKRYPNSRKRLHITLELSWSADRAIQQFGRTHRSNQMYPPEYLFVISELAGEKRFACVVAKRLEALGALTHGDRRATETRDLSQFNIDTKYGRIALDKMIETLNGNIEPCCELPKYSGNFLAAAQKITSKLFHGEQGRANIDSKGDAGPKIHKFLNRLLGVEVDLQNAIYEFYTSILDFHVKDAQLSGKFDFGIIDYGLGTEVVVETSKTRYDMKSSSGATTVEMIAFNIERGITFEQASSLLQDVVDPNVGFYQSKESNNSTRHRRVMLVLKGSNPKNSEKVYTCSRPNTGFGTKTDSIENLTKNYIKVEPHQVKDEWRTFYESSGTMCVHLYYNGTCKTKERMGDCDVGRRGRSVNLLCGAIFSVWNIIEETFGASPIRMARITTKDKIRRIGVLIPTPYLGHLDSALSRAKVN